MTVMNDQETHICWYLNLETVEWLSNIFILHLKLFSIFKCLSALITMGNMIQFASILVKNTLKISLMTLVVAMVISKLMKVSIIDFILCLKLMFSG